MSLLIFFKRVLGRIRGMRWLQSNALFVNKDYFLSFWGFLNKIESFLPSFHNTKGESAMNMLLLARRPSTHFTDGTTEAQRGGGPCSWSHSWEMQVPVLELGSARPSNKLPHCVGLPHPLPHPRKIQPVSQKLQFAQHTHRSSFPPTFPPEGYGTLIHHDQGSQISPRSYLRPEAPRIPAIEPLRAPRSISLSKPGEKVGS